MLKNNIHATPIKATNPRITQKGINLGYCFAADEPSGEIAIASANKFKKHSIPKLKKNGVCQYGKRKNNIS